MSPDSKSGGGSMFEIGSRREFPGDLAETVEAFKRVTTGSLGHLTDFGLVNETQPLVRPQKAVGPAFTVRIPALDATAVHYALNLIEAGEVLVIDTCGERKRACWGGVVAHAAMRAGVAAVVVDGPVTDWEELTVSGPPTWCWRGQTTAVTGRRLGLEGAVLTTVQVGGAVVHPGDIVFADTDGVFIVPAEGSLELAQALETREAREPVLKQRLDAGERLGDISGAAAAVEEMLQRA
jgi:4-hydroxy-4-methyl-2-oxoglutarate aldolase